MVEGLDPTFIFPVNASYYNHITLGYQRSMYLRTKASCSAAMSNVHCYSLCIASIHNHCTVCTNCRKHLGSHTF